MARPVVGIIGNSYVLDDHYPIHSTGTINSEAIARVADAIPLIIPSDPKYFSIGELMEVCDGFFFTGGRPNVHPEEYGVAPTPAHGAFDRNRDRVALTLLRQCVERGQPVLGACRGFQEFNVAFGGTLHPEIRELPGRMNHRMPPEGGLDEKFALRHYVDLIPGGLFATLMGTTRVKVNSLHGQGILSPGERIAIEGSALDGTPEALQVTGARGFALAVQWHPEYRAESDPVSRELFGAFGEALSAWQRGSASSTELWVA